MLKFPFQLNGVRVTYSLLTLTKFSHCCTKMTKENFSMLGLPLGTQAKHCAVSNREHSSINSISFIKSTPCAVNRLLDFVVLNIYTRFFIELLPG